MVGSTGAMAVYIYETVAAKQVKFALVIDRVKQVNIAEVLILFFQFFSIFTVVPVAYDHKRMLGQFCKSFSYDMDVVFRFNAAHFKCVWLIKKRILLFICLCWFYGNCMIGSILNNMAECFITDGSIVLY